MTERLACPKCHGPMEYHDLCPMDGGQHFYCLRGGCGTLVPPARLARERDAALEALRQASDAMRERGDDLFDLHMESGSDLRPAYRSLWDAARAARQTITGIETGAIHNDQA